MKNLLLTGMVACMLTLAMSFLADKDKKKKMQQDEIPPGTVRFKDSLLMDSLFMDEYEVSNIAWREFLAYLDQHPDDSVKYEQMLPDTTVWMKIDPNYSRYYLRYPDYNDFPLVGVSYEQAIAFCKWRSARVNELYGQHPEANPYPGAEYTYRLPTIKEWELMAAGGRNVDSFPYAVDSVYIKYNKNWEKAFNCYYGKRRDLYSNETTIVAPVESYFPNAYGIYNAIGNVAEMVAEKGIAKGGGFDSELKYCTIKDEEHYVAPMPFLGFRCICQISLSAAEIRQKRAEALEAAGFKRKAERGTEKP